MTVLKPAPVLNHPVYQDHRYGLTVGGPITIPHLYDGRNRTFFFYAWEGNRYTSPATTSGQTSTVPTAAERAGDFSALLKLGSQYQIYNPFTTQAAANGRFQRDPVAGNIIPASLLSPVGLALAGLYPLPNQPGTPESLSNHPPEAMGVSIAGANGTSIWGDIVCFHPTGAKSEEF